MRNRRFEWDIVTDWEWFGFFVSWIATTLSMLIASSTRPGSDLMWQDFVSEWLIIPLMLLAVGDVIFGTIELGIRFGSFDLRMTDWIVRRKEDHDQIEYLKALEESNKRTQAMPQQKMQPESESELKCWCGKPLKNERAYNAHLRAHKNEALTYNSPEEAYNKLNSHYSETIENADFQFPSLSDFSDWFDNSEQ